MLFFCLRCLFFQFFPWEIHYDWGIDGIFCNLSFFGSGSAHRSEEKGESADRASRLHNHCCVAWDRSTGWDVVGNGSDHPNRWLGFLPVLMEVLMVKQTYKWI